MGLGVPQRNLTMSAICWEIDATRLGISVGLEAKLVAATMLACSWRRAATASALSPCTRCHSANAVLCWAGVCVAIYWSAPADEFAMKLLTFFVRDETVLMDFSKHIGQIRETSLLLASKANFTEEGLV